MTQYQSVGLVMKHFLKKFLKHKPQGQLLAFYSEIQQKTCFSLREEEKQLGVSLRI